MAGVFGPPLPSATGKILEVTPMALSNRATGNYGQGEYIPEEDVTETLEDGRMIQIAVKGHPIPMGEAVKLDLVKQGGQPGPSETKPAKAGAETKSEKDGGTK